MRYIRQHPLPLISQLNALRRMHPEGLGNITKTQLIWRQNIRPDPLGENYSIELRYSLQKHPKILVRNPDLKKLAAERSLPHIYRDNPENDGMVHLCLDKMGDWTPQVLIAITMIPWASEWFWFFEYWLINGDWRGGGTHEIAIKPPPREYTQFN